MIHLSATRLIFSEGDLATGIYIVCSGKVKVFFKSNQRKKHIQRLAGPGQILGHRGFSDSMVYSVSAETLTDCEIAFIETDDFIKLLRKNHDMNFSVMLFFANELFRSEQRFRIRSRREPDAKVALALVMVLEAFGTDGKPSGSLDLTLNFRELANFSQVALADLAIALKGLDEKGVIKLDGKEIRIIREEELRQIAGSEAEAAL
jgi:CRP/FNR family transcriptional regulator